MPPKQLPLDFSPKDTTRLDNTGTKRPLSGVTTSKLIKCGSLIETYEYQYPVRYGHRLEKEKRARTKSARCNEYRIKTIIRACNRIRQLAHLNFTERDKFLTLTFNNEQAFDINDLKSCLPYYQKFIRRLRKRHPNLRFITVPEFQKRGAVHYHVLCNIPFIPKPELQKLWPYGFSKPKAVQSTTHLALYLSKYLSKRFEDTRKEGHRLFYTSRDLKQPTILYGPIAEIATARMKELSAFEVQYRHEYETVRNGKTEYKQYLKKET